MKKKHLTNMKKTLSVFLTVLMIMTCWVFVPGEHNIEAEALANINTYRKADKYGTPYWDGSNTYYSKWNSGSSYTTIKWPKHIYMDISETLQSAGYYYTVDWQYGSNTNYRIINNGFIFGGWGMENPGNWPANYNTMNNMFNNYNLDGSLSNGGFEQTTNSTDGDLFVGVSGLNWSGAKAVIFRTRASTNSEKVFMLGTPKAAGTGTYSTSGSKPGNFGGWQEWKKANFWSSESWNSSSDNYTASNDSSNWTTDCYDGTWKEIIMNVTIYDKSTLGAAVTKANDIYNGSSAYYAYATSATAWNTFTSQRSNGSSKLKTREIDQNGINTAKSSLDTAIGNLKFVANNSSLKDAISKAEATVNKSGFDTLYTEATAKALKNALESAKNSTLSSSVTTYEATNDASAGAKAAAEQNTINNLANGITSAISNLKRKYDVGYDNLFSFTDWAASPSSTSEGGTVSIDVDTGTISITDNADVEGTDTFTNHGSDGMYTVKVKANTNYVFEYYGEGANGTVRPLIFDTNAAHNGFDAVIKDFGGNGGKQTIRFTSPSNDIDADGYTYIHFRFGVNGVSGGTATYKNIALYEESVYDAYAKDYDSIRQVFTVGDTDDLSLIPRREGWVFDVWVDKNNNPVTSVAGLTASDTVYATWTKVWTVTFLDADGNVIGSPQQVKEGEDATAPSAPTKASDASASYTFTGWDKDFTNVTGDITVKPQFTPTAHGNFTFSSVSASATCTQNAILTKKCGKCNYNFGKVAYNPTEDANASEHTAWLATGHDFTGGETYIKRGTSDGNTDTNTHEVKCKNCDETERQTHLSSWKNSGTEGATCTTPGTVHWYCPCGAEKTTQGDIAPDVHNFDGSVVTSNGDGKTHNVHCTYNNEHTKTVNCTDANDDCICDVAGCGQNLIHVYNQMKAEKAYERSPATCTADAVYYYACKCGDKGTTTWTDKDSMLEHIWENTETYLMSDADCENDAVYYKKCSLCGASSEGITNETWTKEGSRTGHDYTGTTIRDNKNGTHSYLCVNGCNTYGYNKVKDAGKDCTYGEWSTTEDDTHTKICSECKHSVTEDHKWSGWTPTDEFKVGEGDQTRTCSVCKKVETKACVYEVTHQAETCTAPEIKTYKCNDCGHAYTVTGKDPSGHDYTDTNDVKSYNNGQHSYGCTKCDTYGFDGIENSREACDYRYENLEAGKHRVICKVCGYNYEQGCSVGENGTGATCAAPAVCGQCGESFGGTTPHNFTEKGGIVAFDEEDKHAYRCEYCKDETKYGIGENENHKQDCSGGKATCSAPAECTVCKKAHGEKDAEAHSWSEWQNISGTNEHQRICSYDAEHVQKEECFSSSPAVAAPDCVNPGFTLNTCDECGHTWHTEPVDALGHLWSNGWVGDGKGNHTRTCARNCRLEGYIETKACYDAEPVVTDPTCTEGGITTHTCDDCGYVWKSAATEATGHSFDKKVVDKRDIYKRSSKNCTTDETYWYRCDNCSVSAETEADKYTDITVLYWMTEGGERTGHKFDEKSDKYQASVATCTERATYFYTCSNNGCDEKGTETYESGAALGHDWVKPEGEALKDYVATEADCINDATYYYVCDREDCGISSKGVKKDGETWTDTGSKLGHNFDYEGGYTAYSAPDCDDEGVKEHWTCKTCSRKYTDKADNSSEISAEATVIEKLGHIWKKVSAKPATCEEDGYTEHRMCTREGCDVKSDSYQKIDAKGHEFLAENGYYADEIYNYHAFKCTNCDAYGVDGVKYNVDYSAIDPEIQGGIKCTFEGEYVNYNDENGIHSHKLICVCGNETSDVCADSAPEKVAPTCTEDGYYKHVCDACGFEWIVASDAEADKALGHDLEFSSNGDGTHSKICKRDGCDYESAAEACTPKTPAATCGNKEVCEFCGKEYGEPAGHTFLEYVHDENSEKCQIDGTKTAKCVYCDATDTVKDEGTALDHVMIENWTYDISGWNGKPDTFDENFIFAPNCHSEGRAIKYCKNEGCDHYITEKVKADPSLHEWEKDAEGKQVWTVISGDCSTGITLVSKCTVDGCGAIDTMEQNVGHSWKLVSYIAPTCAKNGYREYCCTVCDQTEEHRYDKAKHDAEGEAYVDADLKKTEAHAYELVSETPATCTKNAYITEKCAVCNGYLITEKENTMLEHKLVDYKAEAPTCEAAGHTAYQKCTDCGTVVGKTMVPATGHGKINDNGKCEDCGRVIYETEDGSSSCGCICHKESGFMRLIYKILNFFWKLFKIGKSCECGNVHW